MIKLLMFKMPFQTNHFNKNQKVWVQRTTGAMAAKVVGKYRGKGKYISAWVKWGSNSNKLKYSPPKFKRFEVNDNFAKRHNLSSHDDFNI